MLTHNFIYFYFYNYWFALAVMIIGICLYLCLFVHISISFITWVSFVTKVVFGLSCSRKSDQRDSLADDDVTNVAAEIFVKPIFHKMPSNLDVAEGQTSRLDSIVIGRPNPEICWYHDGKQVYSDRSHKIVINQDGVNSLIFLPVSLLDSGSYRCVASNGGGEDSFEVSVSVTRKWCLLLLLLL